MSEEKDKPVFDEQTLAKVLEAAYVLQKHNRALQKADPQKHEPTPKSDQPVSKENFVTHAKPLSPLPRHETKPTPAQPASKSDYAQTLAQIVETQQQIQVRRLELGQALSLVVARVAEIAQAGGAAVGILEGNQVRYRAAAGLMSLPVGTEVPLAKALCLDCLRTGDVIRCADVRTEFLLDAEQCLRRGIQALIAVPVYHGGGIAGGLELYYATTQAFSEQDVHTCQLMAGLVTEALARDEELASKKSVATERAAMLEALEKLTPNLAALVEPPPATLSAARTAGQRPASSTPTFVCGKCGHQLVGEEQFCGNCGSPRGGDNQPPGMQSKVAALWRMQEAMKKPGTRSHGNADLAREEPTTIADTIGLDPARPHSVRAEKSLADPIPEKMPELFAAPELRIYNTSDAKELPNSGVTKNIGNTAPPILEVPLEAELVEAPDKDKPSAETIVAKPVPAANWTSAANARAFLEQLAATRPPGGLVRFWNARRGDIYLAVAVLLVAVVIRWGIWASHPVSATGKPATAAASHRKPAANAKLPLFDRMLISLGLAEAPPVPESKGNPDIRVWVDLHTALYYCPGADLYGKTPKGRYASQRDAQLDQFEPAYRKACD